MFNALKKWWKGFCMSSEERYLNEAVDVTDLENRLRSMEYGRCTNRTDRYYTKYWL